ncbi:MAG: hypothetical protein K9N51_06395 [Candidatus Pacebacteria bacterium]|nr:hypothetical protein [Candidatus Paceibacterota bacterium]
MHARLRGERIGCLFIVIISLVLNVYADEAETLAGLSSELRKTAEQTQDINRKLALGNACSALDAARDALEEGNEPDAKKNKKKALKWLVQAVRECMAPGKPIDDLTGALREENAMSEDAVERFNKLLDRLVDAKQRKKKSDFPFFDGLVLNQLILALFEVIDSGGPAFHPQKALRIYVNAAAACEDVQEQIDKLLDFLGENADATGITDISPEARDKAKGMVDKLYTMKAEGASGEDIIEMAEKIKKFLEDEGARIGRLRREKDMREAEKEEDQEHLLHPRPVTMVTFTALEGRTNVNTTLVGEVQTIQFVAVDGEEMDPREVAPDVDPHADSFTLDLGKTAKLGGVIIGGTAGVIRLLQDGEGSAPATHAGIEPKDGVIDTRNGQVDETFNVTDGAPDMERAPGHHSVTIDDQAATVVATRADQVAVTARSIKTSVIGNSQVKLTTPTGTTLSGRCASWGYTISMPKITKTDVWVPISANVYGLEPDDRVMFHFMPEPGQQIEPRERIVSAAELMAPAPVAEIRVDRAGPQALNVTVSLGEWPKNTVKP